MKYLISDVLAGLEARYEERLKAAELEVKNVVAKPVGWDEDEKIAYSVVGTTLQYFLEQWQKQKRVTRHDLEVLEGKLSDVKRRLPTHYQKGSDHEHAVKLKREVVDRVRNNPPESRDLYIFLKTVQDSGETHVSQNAIRQAGISGYNIGELFAAKKRRDDANASRQAESEQ